MNKKISHPMNRLAMLLGLAMASMGAHAADVGSATATVSNLRYRLIDLDVNDGIAPSLTLASGSLSGTVGSTIKITPDGETSFGDPYIANNPTDTGSISSAVLGQTGTLELLSAAPGAKVTLGSTLSASTGLSAASIAGGAISGSSSYTYSGTSVDYTRGDNLLRNFTTTSTSINNSVSAQQNASISTVLAQTEGGFDPVTGYYTSPTDLPNLVLSANTLLLIEGTATVGLGLDQAGLDEAARLALDQTGLLAPGLNGYGSFNVNANASVQLSLTRSYLEILPGGSSASGDAGGVFTLSNGWGASGYFDGVNTSGLSQPAPDSSNDSKTFALAYTNLTDASVQTLFSVNLQASTGINGYAYGSTSTTTWGDPIGEIPVPTPTPGIPEPSTYALMGLGLVGMAVAARRHRRRQGV